VKTLSNEPTDQIEAEMKQRYCLVKLATVCALDVRGDAKAPGSAEGLRPREAGRRAD
jgi:hypothetical protein